MFAIKVYANGEVDKIREKATGLVSKFHVAAPTNPEVFKNCETVSHVVRGKAVAGKVMKNTDGSFTVMKPSTNRFTPFKPDQLVAAKHRFEDQAVAERALRLILAFDTAERSFYTVETWKQRKIVDASDFSQNLEDVLIDELAAGKWDEVLEA